MKAFFQFIPNPLWFFGAKITTWQRQLGSTPGTQYNFGYDGAGQLISAVLSQSGSNLKNHSYTYYAAGNRTRSLTGVVGMSAAHNPVNQLTALTNLISSVQFAGKLDKPGTVTVNGQAATVNAANEFSTRLELPPGDHQVDIRATDAAQKTTTTTYRVRVESGYLLTYDAAGNLIEQEMDDDKTRIYTWDAANRLLSIQSDKAPLAGDWRTEFAYDGQSRRARKKEYLHNGTTWTEQSHKTYLWCGAKICQERDASGASVLTDYFAQGHIKRSTNQKWYTTRDHLGSIRETVSQNQTLGVRYDYSPYGEVETVDQVDAGGHSDFRYTGHFYHERSGLHLTLYRAYDPGLGRWLSADPIGEDGGLNLYGYVGNDPVNGWDTDGLQPDSQQFWDSYPNYNDYGNAGDVWDSVGGWMDKSYGGPPPADSCATRVSKGLNGSKEPIKPTKGIKTDRNTDGNRYIMLASHLRRYLTKNWGKPDRIVKNLSDLEQLQKDLKPNQVAIICSDGHAGAVRSDYNDKYAGAGGDVWILPVSP